MPVYLCHGFRWPRPLIRIHIILQNLDDAAAEWLVAPNTTATLTKNFHQLFPDAMEYLPQLRFLEQYDPDDVSANAASQPYAYVADVVEEVKLGIDVDDIRSRGVGNEQWAALLELRDKLAPEEKVAWYVVVCGDEERWAPPTIGQLQTTVVTGTSSPLKRTDTESTVMPTTKPTPDVEPKGLKKFFGSARLARRKSRPNMDDLSQVFSDPAQPPPIPTSAIDSKPPQIPMPSS